MHLQNFTMKQKLLLLAFVCIALNTFAQKNYWKPVSEYQALKMNKGQQLFVPGSFIPSAYKLFTLDEDAIRAIIKQSPMEGANALSASRAIIEVPMANGFVERFRIVEAPVMQPKLQAKYSNIRSYAGQGIDDPKKNIRFDITPIGIHLTIGDVEGKKIYINPINNSIGLYEVNERSANDKNPAGAFTCSMDGSILKGDGTDVNKTTYVGNADDGKLHTYRLALCVTGTWSRGIMTGTEVTTQDSLNTVMSAITGYLVRANEVYERDLAIRLVFVNNEDTLIFLNPATDPFGSLNSNCQKTCDARIGDANYDFGHVIDKGANNGNAGCINCVCKTGSKGSGMTQYNNVSTATLVDYFIIDYWTHEMGHQVGANHTFTYSSEGTLAQIEPGSGVTIMGYAGITGNTDVAPHSNDLFACASIAQISNSWKNSAQGGKCAVVSSAGNKVPVANAGKDYIIPKKTPFALTGMAGDTNKTDVQSYVWEQTDVMESPGFSTIPKGSNTKGPMFRTYNYSTSATRYFPQLSDILLGKDSTKFEVLPAVSRDMNFRFTVRDNHPGGGANKSDDMLVTVDGTSGPFKILYPNTAISKKVGDTLKVSWSVANTNIAPVNCQKVRIVLSIDGGQTFTTFLDKAAANNGTAVITIPNKITTTARIAITAVGNVFFDVSNADFTIKAAEPLTNASVSAASVKVSGIAGISPNPATDKATIIFGNNFKTAAVKISNAVGKVVYQTKPISVNAGQQVFVDVSNFAKGIYFVNIIADGETSVEKLVVE